MPKRLHLPREKLPPQLRKVRGYRGFAGLWRRTARVVYSPRVMEGLPGFTEKIASSFWEVDADDAVKAINHGDVAFFVAFLIRVDQIDSEMAKLGRSYVERSPLIRCRYIIDGFMQAAIERLREEGGSWPLSGDQRSEPEKSPS